MFQYKLALAGLAGALIGAAGATFVCYTMWYKNQKALMTEVDRLWDRNLELNNEKCSYMLERDTLEEKLGSFEHDIQRGELVYRSDIDTDDDDALCEEDGPEPTAVNACADPRYMIAPSDDIVDLWSQYYAEIEVHRDPYGSLYRLDSAGYQIAFYADQVGGTGNLIKAVTSDFPYVIDKARGVYFHIIQDHEEDMEPTMYEYELDNEDYDF